MRVMITGAAGFIGHHLVEHLLKTTDWELALVDKLSYASTGLSRLRDINALGQAGNRVHLFTADVSLPIGSWLEREIGSLDYIIHLAAETHVDNSIADPRTFVMSNVVGTMEVLEFARRMQSRLKKFVYFSTDEVFGPAPQGIEFEEWARYNSTNPYSATKAAGEELALAWSNSYGLPLMVTHCMNCFGERQHQEKFIPMVVRKILGNESITIHADVTRTKPGSRSYIHCRNVADALTFLLAKWEVPMGMPMRDKFNIRGEQEVDNLELVRKIHRIMEKAMGVKFGLRYELVNFHGVRPGHDLRYALSGKKMEELGWKPPSNFDLSLERTINWMVAQRNLHWLFKN